MKTPRKQRLPWMESRLRRLTYKHECGRATPKQIKRIAQLVRAIEKAKL